MLCYTLEGNRKVISMNYFVSNIGMQNKTTKENENEATSVSHYSLISCNELQMKLHVVKRKNLITPPGGIVSSRKRIKVFFPKICSIPFQIFKASPS